MKPSEISKKMLEEARNSIISNIENIINNVEKRGYVAEIDLTDRKCHTLVYRPIDDQFNEVIGVVKPGDATIFSDAGDDPFDISFSELSNEMLIEILAIIENVDIEQEFPVQN